MTATYAETLRAVVQQNLRDPNAAIWTTTELDNLMAQVVREISLRAPLQKKANLAIVDYTKDINISSLTFNEIKKVEYPVGNGEESPVFRNFTIYGTNLSLDLRNRPAITSGSLTGTSTTFTKDSRTVTGSGTTFTTELTEGYLLRTYAGTKYYQIAEIVSDTSLVLVEPFEETTVTDSTNKSVYRDSNSCARVYYDAAYTVSTSSDMPTRYDEVAVLGVVAHAATEYGANFAQGRLTAASTALSSATTALSSTAKANDRIVQAVADLASGRGNLAGLLTAFDTAIADAEGILDTVHTDMDTATTVVDTINVGGDVAGKYVQIGQTNVVAAKEKIGAAKSYLEKAKVNEEYLQTAGQELAAANAYIAQAQNYIVQADSTVNVSRMVSLYQNWAAGKYNEYQNKLRNIGRNKVHVRTSRF